MIHRFTLFLLQKLLCEIDYNCYISVMFQESFVQLWHFSLLLIKFSVGFVTYRFGFFFFFPVPLECFSQESIGIFLLPSLVAASQLFSFSNSSAQDVSSYCACLSCLTSFWVFSEFKSSMACQVKYKENVCLVYASREL